MTIQEVKNQLKAGQFGLLMAGKHTHLKQIHGIVKEIDVQGKVSFMDNDNMLYLFTAEDVKSFEPKEKHPKLTKYKGEDVHWDGGVCYYTRTKQICEPKR